MLRRGGTIGGSSAGAAIMSKVMIAGGKTEPQMGNGLRLLARLDRRPALYARNRLGRLMLALKDRSGLVGFGIDQGTSLIVRGRTLSVMGDGGVTICMSPAGSQPERVTQLLPGKTADLIAPNRAVLARNLPPFPPTSPQPPDVPTGSLVIVGGGGTPKGLLEKFIELAGGPEAPLVCVPCTAEETIDKEPGMCEAFRRAGAKHVSWIHTKDRTKANGDDAILAPLKSAPRHLVRRRAAMELGRQLPEHDRSPAYARRAGSRRRDRRLVGRRQHPRGLHAAGRPAGERRTSLPRATSAAWDSSRAWRSTSTSRNASGSPDMSLLMKTYPQSLGIGIDESDGASSSAAAWPKSWAPTAWRSTTPAARPLQASRSTTRCRRANGST